MNWNHRIDSFVVSRGTSPDFGLVAPNTVTARLFLLDIWRLGGQQSDIILPDDIRGKIIDWVEELPTLNKITVPRCDFQGIIESAELHICNDSSNNAFLEAAYLRANVHNSRGVISDLAYIEVGTSSSSFSSPAERRSPKGTHNNSPAIVNVDRHHHVTTIDPFQWQSTRVRRQQICRDTAQKYRILQVF